ncbi:MAG: response regulator [Solirubrobacteraceae bacterium]
MSATSDIDLRTDPATPAARAVLPRCDWKPRVLVVDDDPVCRAAAHSVLERLGLKVDLAVGGRQALEMARAWPYVAIFMDCFMPGVDGYEATRQIRGSAGADSSPLMIAVTTQSRHVCLAAGMDHYVGKPMRFERLSAEARSLGLIGPCDSDPKSAGAAGAVPAEPLLGPGPALGPERVARLRAEFLTRAVGHLPGLWRAANRGDAGAVSAITRDLELRAASVGADRISAIAGRMVFAVRLGETAGLPSAVADLRRAIADTERELHAPAVADLDVAAAASPAPAAPQVPAAPQAPPATIRVAIADDDPLAKLAIETIVERGDRLVLVGSAAGVDEIVALVERERPDVVVVDFMMSGGGGPAAARRIRAISPATRVLALTARDTPDAYLAMLHAGADGLLVKGATGERLVALIHRAFDRAAAARRAV